MKTENRVVPAVPEEAVLRVIMSEGGTKERIVPINKVTIPDLWHLAVRERSKNEEGIIEDAPISVFEQSQVLETWHLCHDLLLALKSIQNGADLTQPIHTK